MRHFGEARLAEQGEPGGWVGRGHTLSGPFSGASASVPPQPFPPAGWLLRPLSSRAKDASKHCLRSNISHLQFSIPRRENVICSLWATQPRPGSVGVHSERGWSLGGGAGPPGVMPEGSGEVSNSRYRPNPCSGETVLRGLPFKVIHRLPHL